VPELGRQISLGERRCSWNKIATEVDYCETDRRDEDSDREAERPEHVLHGPADENGDPNADQTV
jgi:hypothetical protein